MTRDPSPVSVPPGVKEGARHGCPHGLWFPGSLCSHRSWTEAGPWQARAASPRLDAPFIVKSQPPVSAPAGGWPPSLPDWGQELIGQRPGGTLLLGAQSPGLGPHRSQPVALLCPQGEGVTPTPGAGRGPTLAGCRQPAPLPSPVLNVVQGDGPHGRLAAQRGFKHNLTGRRGGCVGRGGAAAARGLPGWPARPTWNSVVLATSTWPSSHWCCRRLPAPHTASCPCALFRRTLSSPWSGSRCQDGQLSGAARTPAPLLGLRATHRSARGSPCGTRSAGRRPWWVAEAG